MNNINNNGKATVKIVELLIEKMSLGLTHSQEKISDEITELTKALVTITTKLGFVGDKIDRMVLVIKVIFAMLTISVLLAGFGSHMLYRHNVNILINEAIKKESKENITRSELKDIISDYLKELNKKEDHNNETFN